MKTLGKIILSAVSVAALVGCGSAPTKTSDSPTPVESSIVEPIVSSEPVEPAHDGLAAATAFTVAEASAFGKSILTENGTFTDKPYYIKGYIMNDSKFKSYSGTFGNYTKDYNFKLVDTADATSDYMSVSYALCAEDLAIGDYVTVYGYMEIYNSYISIYPLSKTYSETAGWPIVTK